ncbi:MAG: nucleotidyltransferase family protein [Verrucomicrobia bacterium]|nr:nucleotidyltransferase family protein [Verrucomicrobiota bacterium]
MKAVILAAGKGTRMKELTNDVPKPMLRVQGKPILEHIIEGLKTTGVREFFIVTGYRAEVVEDYFGDGSKFGVQVSYGRQIVQDGTGKAPELAKDFVGDSSFILTYGDILVKPETYQQMLARYGDGKFSGLVTVTGSEDVTKGGLFFFDENFCLNHLVEKPNAAQLAELRQQGLLANTNSPTPSSPCSKPATRSPACKSPAAGWTCATRKCWPVWKEKVKPQTLAQTPARNRVCAAAQ